MHDYVIVGAGSAGCVLASRLSEDRDTRVLLIEAGPPDDSEDIHLPLGYLGLSQSEFDWNYQSAPEAHCADRRIRLPRGRVLGGSSSVNAMIYMRGNPADYDDWGVRGWRWEDLLPYFLKAEDNQRGASARHGTGGPLTVSDPRSPHPICYAFLGACEQTGVRPNEDFNGEAQDGAGLFQVTQRAGRRESAADAYLRPALDRANLTVMTDTTVTSVHLDGGRASGVRAVRDGIELELGAAREVIVCGGAYNSPKLLMLSGIGPGEHLRDRGVEIVLDRPAVGENLSDHLASEVLWTAPEPEDRSARRRWRSARLMLATQAGAFASTLAEAGAFLRLGPGAPAPDIQLHCAPVYFAEAGQIPEAQGVWVSPCLLTPASRGSVRLAAANPSIDLEIENRFGSAPDDLRRLAAGVRFAMALGGAPALKPFCAEAISAPEDTDQQAVSDHIARTAFAFYHPVGTCRMGSDAHAVVDEQLRVRGVADLRVIDASVMPVVPRGNTNAPTIALAERAADLLRHGRALSAPGSD